MKKHYPGHAMFVLLSVMVSASAGAQTGTWKTEVATLPDYHGLWYSCQMESKTYYDDSSYDNQRLGYNPIRNTGYASFVFKTKKKDLKIPGLEIKTGKEEEMKY